MSSDESKTELETGSAARRYEKSVEIQRDLAYFLRSAQELNKEKNREFEAFYVRVLRLG